MHRIVCLTLLLLCLVLGGCSKFDLLNAAVPRGGYALDRDVAYGPLPRQRLDVYRPRERVKPAGVVVFFYGGDWQNGSKADYRFVGQALASRGFVAVLPDYRLYPQVTFPAFVEDGALAVRWAHDHLGDAGPLHLMGHSAGAHVAALLALDDHYLKNVGLDRGAVRAAALLSGPYNFVPPPADRGVFSMPPGRSPARPTPPSRSPSPTRTPRRCCWSKDSTTRPSGRKTRHDSPPASKRRAARSRRRFTPTPATSASCWLWRGRSAGTRRRWRTRRGSSGRTPTPPRGQHRPPPAAAALPSSAPAPTRRPPG